MYKPLGLGPTRTRSGLVGIHSCSLQILRWALSVAMCPEKALFFNTETGTILPPIRRRAMEPRTVSRVRHRHSATFSRPAKTFAFAEACASTSRQPEVFPPDAVADFGFVLRSAMRILYHLERSHVGLLKWRSLRLVDHVRLDEVNEAQLRGIVAVFIVRARTTTRGLPAGERVNNPVAVFGEDLTSCGLIPIIRSICLCSSLVAAVSALEDTACLKSLSCLRITG